jgi:hypothetical protein
MRREVLCERVRGQAAVGDVSKDRKNKHKRKEAAMGGLVM